MGLMKNNWKVLQHVCGILDKIRSAVYQQASNVSPKNSERSFTNNHLRLTFIVTLIRLHSI